MEREREKLLSIGRKPSRQNSCLILKSIQHRSRPLPFLLKYWHYSFTHPLPHPPLQETCTQHINPPTPIQQVKETKTDQECIWKHRQKEKEKYGAEKILQTKIQSNSNKRNDKPRARQSGGKQVLCLKLNFINKSKDGYMNDKICLESKHKEMRRLRTTDA